MRKFAFMVDGCARERKLIKRRLIPAWFPMCLLLFLACLSCLPANCDVGVVLNESLDTSVARITGSGHSAVYLSRVCAESPVKLRFCRPGEQGSVISNYTTLGEDQPFEWNVVPLSVYLYGVENPRNRPVFGSFKIKRVLEERYREKYLEAYCASQSCKTSNKAEWREMVGAALSRSINIFVVDTSVDQDRDFIAEFNALPNQNHFNGVTRNCADFTRRLINSYFPHAAGPDYLNDFGMTSPKAIARSFTRYALRHPEARFRVLHVAQLPGTIKRSSEARAGTEQLYHSKKLLIPMLIFADYELPAVAATYLLTGRFNPQHEFEEHPTAEAAEISHEIQLAKAGKEKARAELFEEVASLERTQVVGTPDEWKQYRAAFDSVVAEAVHEEIIPGRAYLDRFLKRLDDRGMPFADTSGALWMEIPDSDETLRVGLSASNILSSGSEPKLADKLVLACVGHILKSPKHSRETMLEFKKDWALLESSRAKNSVLPSTASTHTAIWGAAGKD
jgi:hypothetical protein